MKPLPIIILVLLVLAILFPVILSLISKSKKSKEVIGHPNAPTIPNDYLEKESPTNFLSKPSGISHYTGGKRNFKPLSRDKKRVLLNG